LYDLNDDALIPAIYDFIEAMLAADTVLPVPEVLRAHVYERFVPPPNGAHVQLVPTTTDDGQGLERIDPVCLMDVDPATTRHSLDYGGRTYYFCAPSCKRAFQRDPESYVLA
jgi:YHS domain-containing protein